MPKDNGERLVSYNENGKLPKFMLKLLYNE